MGLPMLIHLFIFCLVIRITDTSLVGDLARGLKQAGNLASMASTTNLLRAAQMAALREFLKKEANQMIELRLNQHFFANGCMRNFQAPCPSGWINDPNTQKSPADIANFGASAVVCSPPAMYKGNCKPLVLPEGASDQLKMAKSAECQVEWPCKSCPLDFNKCPIGWEPVIDKKLVNPAGNLKCKAAGFYAGICDPEVNFIDTNFKTRAVWATRCSVRFPCLEENPIQPAAAQTPKTL